jgi:hypothetical protein
MQALLSSARLLAQARSVTEAAMAIFFICIGPPDPLANACSVSFSFEGGNVACAPVR